MVTALILRRCPQESFFLDYSSQPHRPYSLMLFGWHRLLRLFHHAHFQLFLFSFVMAANRTRHGCWTGSIWLCFRITVGLFVCLFLLFCFKKKGGGHLRSQRDGSVGILQLQCDPGDPHGVRREPAPPYMPWCMHGHTHM